MGSPQLENLVRIRQLKEEAPSRAEVDGLIRSGNVRLTDPQIQTLSLDSRFDLAYNAAHAFSLAALRWHGFRSENRFTVFHSASNTRKSYHQHNGAYSIMRTASETSQNTRATWTLIKASWKR